MPLAQEFKKFALRGNMVDLAIGFTVGAAFTTIARSLVDDIIMPPLGLVVGTKNFSNYFLVLKDGRAPLPQSATIETARELGAVTWNYGQFLNSLLAFFVVAVAMFIIMRIVNKIDASLERKFGQAQASADEPCDKKCQYCLSTIPYRATRCPHCTSELPTPTA
jgi:large conductance mechanosensitive channel